MLRDAKKRAFRLLFFSCFTWIGYSHWLLSQRVPFISAARPINRRATSIPNLWFSSCSATQKKRAFRLLFFGCFTWIGYSHWLLSQRAPFISAARPINRRTTSIPNRWFSSCSATQKKRAFRLLFFGCFTWIRTTINGVRVRCPTIRR